MQEVAKMVAQSCSTCSKAMRAEGVKVKLLTASCLCNECPVMPYCLFSSHMLHAQ